MASPDFPSTRRVPNPRNAAPMGPASSSRSVTSLLANRAPGGATPIPPSLQAKMAAMANRANHANHPQPREVDNATAALKHASLNSLAPNPVPPPPAFPRGSPAVRGGLRRNRPGFKLSDITGESSAGPSSAGLGAGAVSNPDDVDPRRGQWPPRRPLESGTPFSNFDSFNRIVDPSGKLNFSGKAVLHQSGVDFSNGNSFAINMSQMQLEDELGRGAYGTVKRVLHKPTNVAMAMKEIRLELDESKLSSIIMELDILHRASHPSIVEFYGAFFIESCVYYCMEYMDAGSLDKLYGAGVPEEILARIVGSMVRGLKFLKDELQIIHRDVKPTNVLINRRGAIKLCDFGVSGHLEKSLAKTNIGCQSYMAPERIKGESQNALTTYTVSSDVWSVGLATLEIALGRYPYPPETFSNVFAQLTAIVHGEPPGLPVHGEEADGVEGGPGGRRYSAAAREWVAGCLVKRPEGRWSYKELLDHPFLQDDVARDVDMCAWVRAAMDWRDRMHKEKEDVPMNGDAH